MESLDNLQEQIGKNNESFTEAENIFSSPGDTIDEIGSDFLSRLREDAENKKLEKERLEIQKNSSLHEQIENMKMVEELTNSLVTYKQKHQMGKYRKTKILLDQINNIQTLEPLYKERYAKSKRNSALVKGKLRNFRKQSFQQATKKLLDNQTYTFLAPSKAISSLRARLSEGRKDYCDKFFELFFSFVNEVSLKKNSVFITETLNRIFNLKEDDYDYKFLDLITNIVEKQFND